MTASATSHSLLERARNRSDSQAWQRLMGIYEPWIRGWPVGSAANLTPGIYYIAVSGYDTIPFYGNPNAVRMFDLSDPTAVVGSRNPNRTLGFWVTNPSAGDTGAI